MNANNFLCNVLAGFGGFITFISTVGIMFGVSMWISAVIGIIIALIGLGNYERC